MSAARTIEQVMRECASAPFEYGSHDCVSFVARVVDRLHGTQYEARLRNTFAYSSGLQAARLVKKAGGLRVLVEGFLGVMRPWTTLRTGDVVLAYAPGTRNVEVLGVLVPSQFVIAHRIGTRAYPLDSVLGGWRIECRKP